MRQVLESTANSNSSPFPPRSLPPLTACPPPPHTPGATRQIRPLPLREPLFPAPPGQPAARRTYERSAFRAKVELVANWKLILEYDGSNFHGWQEQTNAKGIASEVRRAAEEFFGGTVDLQASGRTDAGVHALAQVIHIRTDAEGHSPSEVLKGINEKLPTSIVALHATEMPLRFHARHDAVARAYVYRFSTRRTAFEKKYVWWLREKLDVAKMESAAQKLVGRHDFAAFAQRDPSKPDESTIVVVNSATVVREDNLILFRIEASHFL